MAEITNKQKLATVSYVEAILHKLQDWMPFKRKNGGILQDSRDDNGEQTLQTTNSGEIALGKYNKSEIDTLLSVGIGSREERKNAISFKKNGEIFIITDIQNYKVESLQRILDKKGVTILLDESELDDYKTFENLGRMFYINNEFGALYVISYKTPSGYDAFKIGDSIETDLSNYYTKEEVYTKEQVRALIDEIKAGKIDLMAYNDLGKKLYLVELKNDSTLAESIVMPIMLVLISLALLIIPIFMSLLDIAIKNQKLKK